MTNNTEKLTQQDLFSKSFYYLNSFKRHRALAELSRKDGNIDKAQYHTLKQYVFIDSLELSLRALQKGQREIDCEDDSE